MAEIYTLNKYYRERFGQKVYKLSLDGGMTCPNRDGTLDTFSVVREVPVILPPPVFYPLRNRLLKQRVAFAIRLQTVNI